MKFPQYLSGFGAFAPERVLTNAELETFLDTSNEWIVSRTGIKERRIAAEGMASSDLALKACEQALARSGFQASDITHIIFASCTPDSFSPPASCVLARKMNLCGCMTLDINVACSGFVYGVEVARTLAAFHPGAVVLLVAAETLSQRCNWEDRSTSVLFGDGAGAVVISTKKPAAGVLCAEIDDVLLESDGSLGELLTIKGGCSASPYKLGDVVGPEYFVLMQGREVFKHAVRSMVGISRQILEKNNLTMADIDLFLPHQANQRIIEAVGERLEASGDQVFMDVCKYGNTSSASIPLALADALAQGYLRPDMRALIVTFGGGFTWGASLLSF